MNLVVNLDKAEADIIVEPLAAQGHVRLSNVMQKAFDLHFGRFKISRPKSERVSFAEPSKDSYKIKSEHNK